jgi:hypothetical protein
MTTMNIIGVAQRVSVFILGVLFWAVVTLYLVSRIVLRKKQ